MKQRNVSMIDWYKLTNGQLHRLNLDIQMIPCEVYMVSCVSLSCLRVLQHYDIGL